MRVKSEEWRVKIGADVSGEAGQIEIVPPAAEHKLFTLNSQLFTLHSHSVVIRWENNSSV